MKKRLRRVSILVLALLLGIGQPVLVKANELPVGEVTGYAVLADREAGIEVLEVSDNALSLDAASVYNRMIAKKEEYPEGMRYTNADYYRWNGGYYSGGYGCAAFAFLLSDAAFGTLPARFVEENSFAAIRVGDILRVNNDTHSVIVLEVHSDYVIIAEGNYNSSIHWGRKLTKANVENSLTYIMTRYPEGYEESVSVTDQFMDVAKGAWYVDSVQFVFDKGIMNGRADGTFGPNLNLTRAEVATVLYNMENKPEVAYTNNFPDVADQKWYSKPISWAYQKNIVKGYASGQFGVADDITREQMAQMLYAYAKMKNYDISYTDGIINQYGDSKKVSNWAKPAMNWAITKGIMSGKGSGSDLSQYKLDPTGNTTRAECAAMLKNFMDAYVR